MGTQKKRKRRAFKEAFSPITPLSWVGKESLEKNWPPTPPEPYPAVGPSVTKIGKATSSPKEEQDSTYSFHFDRNYYQMGGSRGT